MTDESFLQTHDKETLHHFIHSPSKHFSSCVIYNFVLKMNNFILKLHFKLIKCYWPVHTCFVNTVHSVLYTPKKVVVPLNQMVFI